MEPRMTKRAALTANRSAPLTDRSESFANVSAAFVRTARISGIPVTHVHPTSLTNICTPRFRATTTQVPPWARGWYT